MRNTENIDRKALIEKKQENRAIRELRALLVRL